MHTPITKRVNDSRSKNLPINQEVTKGADGGGGPVDLPGGSPAKIMPAIAAAVAGKVVDKIIN